MCKKFAIFSPPGMSFMSSLVMERSAIVDTRYTITATAMATSMHSAMRDHDTKEEIQIPASRVPVFKAGKALKDVVAK